MAKKIDERFWTQAFDPEGHAVCEKDFRYGADEYERGQVFPWRKYELHSNDLRGLWLADFVTFFDAKAAGYVEKGLPVPQASAQPLPQRTPGDVAKRPQRRA